MGELFLMRVGSQGQLECTCQIISCLIIGDTSEKGATVEWDTWELGWHCHSVGGCLHNRTEDWMLVEEPNSAIFVHHIYTENWLFLNEWHKHNGKTIVCVEWQVPQQGTVSTFGWPGNIQMSFAKATNFWWVPEKPHFFTVMKQLGHDEHTWTIANQFWALFQFLLCRNEKYSEILFLDMSTF